MPAASSDLPESRPGKPVAFCLVLLRMGFTCAPPVARRAVVSYSAFPPLPGPKALSGNAPFSKHSGAVYFCCTGLGVASTGRYPASCPVKPGLSSPAAALTRKRTAAIIHSTHFLLYTIPPFPPFCKSLTGAPAHCGCQLRLPVGLAKRWESPFIRGNSCLRQIPEGSSCSGGSRCSRPGNIPGISAAVWPRSIPVRLFRFHIEGVPRIASARPAHR